MHPVLNHVVGGWAISGIWQYVSGEYLRIQPAIVSGNPTIDHRTCLSDLGANFSCHWRPYLEK